MYNTVHIASHFKYLFYSEDIEVRLGIYMYPFTNGYFTDTMIHSNDNLFTRIIANIKEIA